MEVAMKRRIRGSTLLAGVALLLATSAQATDPFFVDVTVDGQNESFGDSSITGLIDQINPDALEARYRDSGADPTRGVVSIDLDFRGLTGVELDFAANTGVLTFQIDALDVNETFGRTCDPVLSVDDCRNARKEALEELKDYLKTNPNFLKRLLSALARLSPIDPLAGNPDSLFSRRQRGDFDYGFTNKVSQIWGCGTSAFNFSNDAPIQVAAAGGLTDVFAEAQSRAAELQAQNEIGFGVMASSTTAQGTRGDFTSTGYVMPLSYTAKLDSDPRKKIRFDLPLSYTETEGAASYAFGVGLAYTHPLTDEWSLTPAIGAGATGSEDLGAAGGVSSYSLTSAYTWRLGGMALSMGNSVGQYDSIGLKLGDVEAEADISNTVFTNGFLLTGPNSLIAKNLVIEYSFIDTRITGDEVYADTYDELGIALGYISTDMGVIDSYTKLGISYLMGDGALGDIESWRLNLTARF
jgi:hypothetical protein